MKYVRYLLGFTLGALFVYTVSALVGWDLNPGNWNGFWRFWCVLWFIIVSHTVGVYAKDRW